MFFLNNRLPLALLLSSVLLGVSACTEDGETKIVEPTPEQVILFATVEGIPEGGVLIQNGEQEKRLMSDGLHELFLVRQSETYSLAVAEPPYDAQCMITHGSGIASGNDVRNIAITCNDIDSAPIFFDLPEDISRSYREITYLYFVITDIEEQNIDVSVAVESSPDGAVFVQEPIVELHHSYPSTYVLSFSTETTGEYEFKVTASDGTNESSALLDVSMINTPPQIYNVSIYPTNPISTVDVSLPYLRVYDRENDQASYSVSWLVNGLMVHEGADALTLSSDYYFKNDVVSVVVTATDGTNAVVEEANITIGDSQGQLSLANIPHTVSEEILVEFTVAWDDPDNDSFPDNVIFNGPEGATIDTAGNVTWQTPRLTFSTQSYDFSVSIEGDQSSEVIGTINVEGLPENQPIVRSATNVGVSPYQSFISVTKENGTEANKIYASDAESLLFSVSRESGNYAQDWVYPYLLADQASIRGLTLADFDNDDIDDVFVAVGKNLSVISGATHKILASVDFDSDITDIEVADLNNDGSLQAVILVSPNIYGPPNNLYVSNVDQLSDFDVVAGSRYGRSIEIGNVDADDALEIIGSGGSVYDGASLTNEWLYIEEFGDIIAVGDIDNDGVDEIVAADIYDDTLDIFSAQSKSSLYSTTQNVCSLHIGDVTGSADLELVVGPCNNNTLSAYILNNNSLSTVWSSSNTNERNIYSVTSGDIDNDGSNEIIYRSGYYQSLGSIQIVDVDNGLDPEWSGGAQQDFRNGFFTAGVRSDNVGNEYPTFSVRNYDTENYSDRGGRVVTLSNNGGVDISNQLNSETSDIYTMALGDVDGDNDEDWIVAFSNYCIALDASTGTPIWQSSEDSNYRNDCRNVTAKDLNADNIAEIALVNNERLEIHNIEDEILIWASDLNDRVYSYLIANLDEDSDHEIVVAGSFGTKLYDITDDSYDLIFTSTDSNTVWGSYDINGDGIEEIITSNNSYHSNNALNFLNSSLETVDSINLDAAAVDVLVQPIEDGADEIYVLQNNTYPYRASITSYSLANGTLNWRSANLIGSISRGAMKQGKDRGDGSHGVLVSTSKAMYVFQ